MKGRCLNRLTNGPKTPQVGLEPTTLRLTAECSAIELLRNNKKNNGCLDKNVKRFHSYTILIPRKVSLDFLSSRPRPISTPQLSALLHLHPEPINPVVFWGSYFFRMGYLILRGASRLDAFSVYPFPTWLLCYALGKTTDSPEVSPSRSSRTKDSSSQISCAHDG